jgi:hypothetical protein
LAFGSRTLLVISGVPHTLFPVPFTHFLYTPHRNKDLKEYLSIVPNLCLLHCYLLTNQMASFLFLILFSSTLLSIEAFEDACPSIQCGHDTPNIQFPFQVKGLQNCGHPGFELVCKDNTTFIPFPSYGELVVKSISYNAKKLNLLDPKNCVHEVFLNLNLSLTPFHYFYVVKNYTYLNCSSRLPPNSFNEVPCLSGSKYHVYTVEPSLAIPNSCRPVKTVAIPFQYSPYLSDNSFGLGLSWDMSDCEAKGGHCGLNFKDKTGCFNLSYDIGNLCPFFPVFFIYLFLCL